MELVTTYQSRGVLISHTTESDSSPVQFHCTDSMRFSSIRWSRMFFERESDGVSKESKSGFS